MAEIATPAPETTPADPVTPAAPAAPSPAVTPAAPEAPKPFSWEDKLPSDNLPSDLESLRDKTFSDFLSSHRELRKQVSTQGEANKGFQTKITELTAQVETLQTKGGAEKLGEVIATSLGGFYETGQIDEEAANEISAHWGIDRQMVGDFYAFLGDKRTTFVNSAAQELGDDGTPEAVLEIMSFVSSDGSPFSPEEIKAFEQAIMRSDPCWIRSAGKRYADHVEAGGQRMQIAQQTQPTPAPSVPTVPLPRGTRPSMPQAGGEGYARNSQFVADLKAATANNDGKMRNAAYDKLEKTPVHIRRGADWHK